MSKQKFLVLVDDFKDSEALARRLQVRDEHLRGARQLHKKGWLEIGGAMVDSHESKKMLGSFLLINAESKEEVLETLKKDQYVVGRAWDMSTIRVVPFVEANLKD